MFFWMDNSTGLLLFLLGLVLSIWAQAMVKGAYGKYSQVRAGSGITGAQLARKIMGDNAIPVSVEMSQAGRLSDHYDPRAKVIRLSPEVYNGDSIAALGIAAHEAGHAIQYDRGYVPIHVRNGVLPLAQLGSFLAFPLVLMGLFFSSAPFLVDIGILLFAAVVFFQMVTLPVEFNASRRALETLEGEQILDSYEMQGARRVLRAAALTYVAALLVSLLQLLRLLLIANRRR